MHAHSEIGLYSLYLVALVVAALVLFGIWRLARRRRPPIPPAEETRPDLKLVPPEPEGAGGRTAVAPPSAAPIEPPTALKVGLTKTRSGFIARIGGLLGKKQLDANLVAELEEILFTADIGARTAQRLFEAVRSRLAQKDLNDSDAVWTVIREESQRLLDGAGSVSAIDLGRARPFVVLIIGVNGAGKTTTIGKLAAQWSRAGKKVLLAAGDTFRAAATEQLEVWGGRVGVPVVRGKEGGDPSSVIFDAVRRAQSEGFDVVIADTAGRLHTKTELMEELQKVRRVIQKALPEAPHETLLVLDSTNGQNAIQQATLFKQAMDITGIVLTKLDGTAKGGVILGICDELKVPVRYIGIGEKVDDLRTFEAAEFVAALYDAETA